MSTVLCDVHVMYLVSVGKSREAEEKRINKELANIRSKFKGEWATVVVAELVEESRKLRVLKCECE